MKNKNFYPLVTDLGRVISDPQSSGESGGGGGDMFIERSLPDLHTDISNNELVPGATYKITGVHKAHTIDTFPIKALYNDGQDLGTTIFLKAISENALETFGSGIFYNPKYDKEVQGFGIWAKTAPNYNVDDIVFWGGYVWKNLNGNIGTDTNILSLNGEWEKLNYNDVHYNKVVDYIEYDIENDLITRRYDTVNEIDVSSGFFDIVSLNTQVGINFSPVSLMQWGNDLYFDTSEPFGVGKISVKHTSSFEVINFKGQFIRGVTFDNGSYLRKVSFDNKSYLSNITFDNEARIYNVTFDNTSRLINVTLDNGSRIYNVTFDNKSYLQNVTLDNESRLNTVTLDWSNLRNVTFDNGSYLQNVTLDGSSYWSDIILNNGSRLINVSFDNGSFLNNVTLDGSQLTNVSLDNSSMTSNTFVKFRADFSSQTYISLNLSTIKFEDNWISSIPDISSATVITNPNIPQKKVFGVNSAYPKIQYWDSVSKDFVIADITD